MPVQVIQATLKERRAEATGRQEPWQAIQSSDSTLAHAPGTRKLSCLCVSALVCGEAVRNLLQQAGQLSERETGIPLLLVTPSAVLGICGTQGPREMTVLL